MSVNAHTRAEQDAVRGSALWHGAMLEISKLVAQIEQKDRQIIQLQARIARLEDRRGDLWNELRRSELFGGTD